MTMHPDFGAFWFIAAIGGITLGALCAIFI